MYEIGFDRVGIGDIVSDSNEIGSFSVNRREALVEF